MKITITNIIQFDVWQKKVKDRQYLRPVFLLNDYLKKIISDELVGFYLHGSLASLDYVSGYSDFDAIAILNNKSPRLGKVIKKINRFPYLIDILQHHPVSLIKKTEMLDYQRNDLPVHLLEGAVALGKSPLELTFEIKDFDFQTTFDEFYEYFKNCYQKKYQPRSAQDLKLFLSQIQLLPALYLQAKTKKWVDKKESFQKAKKDFGREWEVIEKATRVRNIWRYSPVFSEKIQNLLLKIPNLERLAWIYGKFLMPIPSEVKKIMGPNMVEETFILAEEMVKKINK